MPWKDKSFKLRYRVFLAGLALVAILLAAATYGIFGKDKPDSSISTTAAQAPSVQEISSPEPGVLPPPNLEEDNCYKVSLPDRGLLWASSGAWRPGGNSILIPDILKRKVMELSVNGSIKELPDFTSYGREFPQQVLGKPSRIRVSNDRYFVEDKDSGNIFVLDDDKVLVGMTPTKNRSMGRDRLMALYDWAPMGGGILAFGDLKNSEGARWESAFIFLDRSRQQILYRLSIEAAARAYYQRNLLPYIAAKDDAGYILFFENTMKIVEFRGHEGGLRELPFFPEDFGTVPKIGRIPGFHGALEATAFYRFFERSRVVAGIFTWRDQLFLLAKSSMHEDGHTDWWLIKVNPANGKEMSRVHLPTKAAHLTVVPGQYWALIEKRPTVPEGQAGSPYMAIPTMTLMPGKWLVDGLRQQVTVTCLPVL